MAWEGRPIGRISPAVRRALICLALAAAATAAGPSWAESGGDPMTEVRDLPSARAYPSAVWDGDLIHVLGGSRTGLKLNDIVTYDPASDAIDDPLLIALPSARDKMAAAWVDGRVVAAGGADALSYLDDIVIYDPSAASVSTSARALPDARQSAAAATIDAYAYILGGEDGSERFADILRYAPGSESLTTLSATLPTARVAMSAAAVGSSIYLFGGSDDHLLDEVVEFDAADEETRVVPALLAAGVVDSAAASDGSLIYIFGGRGTNDERSALVHRFDPSNAQMALMSARLPSARMAAAAVWADDAAYVVGGWTADVEVSDILRYDPSLDTVENLFPRAVFDFTVSGRTVDVDAGDSVDDDGSILSYRWDWGDDHPAEEGTDPEATHQYADDGTYTITLTLEDSAGGPGGAERTVTIRNERPTARFTLELDGSTVTVDGGGSSDRDGDVTQYRWDWGDVSGFTFAREATHTYTAAGSYDVTLRVLDNDEASDERTEEVTIAATDIAPSAALSLTIDGLSVTADGGASSDLDGAVESYTWSWGDGSPTETGESAQHTYAQGGTYTVSLTVSDDDGLSATASQAVSVAPPSLAPVASFAFTSERLRLDVDASDSSDLDGTIASYAWDWGDGGPGAAGERASHAYDVGGTYTVVLSVRDDQGLEAAATRAVTVDADNAAPIAVIRREVDGLTLRTDGSGSSDADGALVEHRWDWGDGSAASLGAIAEHAYAQPDEYTVTLTVTDDGGTNAAASERVAVGGGLPGAPRNVSASPGPGAGETTLRWDAPLGWSPELLSYRVYRFEATATAPIIMEAGHAHTFVDPDLPVGALVRYRVSAEGPDDEGPLSNEVSVTVPTTPPASDVGREVRRILLADGEHVHLIGAAARVEVAFTDPSSVLDRVAFDLDSAQGSLDVTMTFHEAPPAGAFEPTGRPLGYIQLHVAGEGDQLLTPSSVVMEYRVPLSALVTNSLSREEVLLLHLDAFGWEALPGRFVRADALYAYYSALSPSASTFAIVGDREAPVVLIDGPANDADAGVLTGRASDDVAIRDLVFELDGRNVTASAELGREAGGAVLFTLPVPASESAQQVTVRASDHGGHATEQRWTVAAAIAAPESAEPRWGALQALVAALGVGVVGLALVVGARLARPRKQPVTPGLSALPGVPSATAKVEHAERYQVVRQIGEGGWGTVFLAQDELLGRQVVLKRLRSEWLGREARELLLREAHAASMVSHANLVSIYDVTRVGPDDLIVMEYVEGGSLEDRLRRGRLAPKVAARIAVAALRGLAALHAAGIVHRDLKPANILLNADLSPKISDFGIARTPGDPRLSVSGMQPGTLLYMSPEQARGMEIDARSDLYSMTVVLYEALAGRHYFSHVPMGEYAARKAIVEDAPQLPVPDIGDALNAVLEKGLAKDPAQRFQTADEMRQALTLAVRPSS